MESVKKRNKDQDLAKRGRNLVRMISRKAFACPNGLFLVNGEPEFSEFLQCLQSRNTAPEPGQIPNPIDLGFAPGKVLRVTRPLLADFGHALQKWHKLIREKDARRVRKRDEAERLKKWKSETERYGRRLERLHALLRETEAGIPILRAYVVLDADPEEADTIIHKECAGMHLPETWGWMGQIVFWLGGSTALRRFLTAPKMVSEAETQQREAVQRFRAGLIKIEKRFSTEGMPFRFEDVHAVRNHNRKLGPKSNIKISFQDAESVKEYIQELFSRENQAIAVLGIRPPRRPRDLGEYLFTISERCNALLKKGFKASSNRRIAELAALCALDRSAVQIPRHLVESNADEWSPTRFICDLVKISTKPGYDDLLVCLEDFNPFSRNYPKDVKPDVLRRLVLAGASAEDLHWLATNDGYTNDSTHQLYSEVFAEAGINPAPLRRLVDELDKFGSACKIQEIKHALNRVGQSKDIRPAKVFAAWLDHSAEQRPDPVVARRIWHTFLDTLNLTEFGLQYRHLVDQWLSAKPLKDAFAGIINPETDEQVLLQIELLARYQHLAGQEIRLTGSLKRILETEARASAELAHLETQEKAGCLTQGANHRLNYLRISEKSTPSVEKVLRKAVELSAITALDGLRKRIDEEFTALWNRFAPGNTTALSVNSGQRLEILRWAHTLDCKHKAVLQELFDAWACAANRYKVRLCGNVEWLEKARSRLGIDVEKWLYPPKQDVTFDGKPFRLAVATDPFQIFLMGSYFDTCLALEKGANRNTVLSNAYEANKQVLYFMDAKGVVLARKLVGITPGGAMVGFRTYLASGIEEGREELYSHIHAFCGTWAGTCGAVLSVVGKPECITDLFWYDDGVEEWQPSAHNSHAAVIGMCLKPGQPIEKLLQKHWDECVRILAELDLWPLEDAETPETMLRNKRGLAEELLAEVALDRHDSDMVGELETQVITGGGWLQVAKVWVFIDPGRIEDKLNALVDDDCRKWKSRIVHLLSLCNSKTAFDKLLGQSIVEDLHIVGVLNIVFALQGRPERAWKLRQNLIEKRIVPYGLEGILTLLHAVQAADGKSHSDRLISRLIYDHATIDECLYSILRLPQWMPPLHKPDRVFRQTLDAAWNDPKITDHYPHLEDSYRVELVVWCLRNPSAAATAFLLEQCQDHPAALLGLALLEPLRYRVRIENAVTGFFPSPSAVLAVLISHGQEAGANFLATLPDYTKNQELVGNTVRMMQAINALDWQECTAVSGFSNKDDYTALNHILPLIMRRIWDSLAEPAGTAGVDRLQSKDSACFLQNAGVSLYGLCLNVIAGLHRYDEQVADRLCLGVRRLLVAAGSGVSGEYRLWLNVLSGDRLFAVNQQDLEENLEIMYFDDPLFSTLYPFLFTNNGERRLVCRLSWMSHHNGPFSLPVLRQDACRFAELLVENLYPQDNFIEAGFVSTILELEGLLLEHYMKIQDERT